MDKYIENADTGRDNKCVWVSTRFALGINENFYVVDGYGKWHELYLSNPKHSRILREAMMEYARAMGAANLPKTGSLKGYNYRSRKQIRAERFSR